MAVYDIYGNAITGEVVTDTTLTKENVPADAKKVGDELRYIQEQLIDGDSRRY